MQGRLLRRGRWRALAHWRFLKLILLEFWGTLALFVGLVASGGILFSCWYHTDHGPMSFVEGVYATLTLLFFSPTYAFPQEWYLRIPFFIVPALGLALLAEGVSRFLTLLVARATRMEDWQMALASTFRDHVVVCGLGRVGYRVCKQLTEAGEDIVAIEKTEGNAFINEIRSLGIPVVVADPTREKVLETINVAHARAIIIVTNNDLANLEIALDARTINPGIRVVLRMFNQSLADKVRKAFNIQIALSTSALAAPLFASASASGAVRGSFFVDGTLVEVAQYRIEDACSIAGKTVGQLTGEYPVSVLALQREGARKLFPDAVEKIVPHDHLMVLATLDTIKRIETETRASPAPWA